MGWEKSSFVKLGIAFVIAVLFIFTINFLKVESDLEKRIVRLDDLAGEIDYPYEVIEKRSYESTTLKNADGSYTTEIHGGNKYFYDGEGFVEIGELSKPFPEKKEIVLTEIPESNLIDFGIYGLHEGISIEVNEFGELEFRDANEKVIVNLPRPFSTDALGIKLENDYVLSLAGNELNVFVEVEKTWLENAKYPVVVDPEIRLGNGTAIEGGKVRRDGSTYSICSLYAPSSPQGIGCLSLSTDFYMGVVEDDAFGTTYRARRAVMEFNTSSISNDAVITDVVLNLSVRSVDAEYVGNNVTISRFKESRISENVTNYPRTSAGMKALWNNISTGYNGLGFYIVNSTEFDTVGNKTLDLGDDANSDLQSQLSNEFFALGMYGTYEIEGDGNEWATRIYDFANNASGPRLFVTYTENTCIYSGSGDWTCLQECNLVNYHVEIDGDLYINSTCVMNLTATTGINFTSPNSKIYVYPGGKISIEVESGFDK